MNMLQSVKRFWWVLLLVAGVPAARGFSFLTPIVGGNTWEIASIDYNDSIRQFSDLGGVGNIGEEYRRNTPVLYYAYNANFLDFFGSNGVVAGDGAFAMMNAAFTNNPTGATHGVDGYSPELSEFPFYSTSVNYTAQSLGLTDLKSIILGLLGGTNGAGRSGALCVDIAGARRGHPLSCRGNLPGHSKKF